MDRHFGDRQELAHRQLDPERWRRWLAITWHPQTYRNIFYLLVSCPLGICYFAFLVPTLLFGLGSTIAGIGVPILFLAVFAWWGLAALERQIAIWWLGIAIPPMYPPRPAGLPLTGWLKAHFGSSVTWTSLLYLLAKFPLGLFSFIITVGLAAISARLIFAPLPYLLDGILGRPLSIGGFLLALPQVPLGLLLAFGSLYLLNGLALLSAHFARLMLGQSDLAARLTATQAVARAATTKAEEADQKRRELIVNVSHELRTPIASIRGHVDSLLIGLDEPPGEAPPPPADLRAYLGIISRETERLGTLVDELLSLARAESGELKIALAPVAASEVVDEVYSAIAPLARRERQITVVRDVEPGLPAIIADRQRLTQVTLNLVRNALSYTPAGGIVSIGLRALGPDRVALVVADTGIGIPQGEFDHIFERFYRTDASRARTSGGFGLGLAIVRDLVAAMGGEVSVESTVGEGSRFTVTLRVAPSRAAEQGVGRRPATAPRATKAAPARERNVEPW
jgi:two-component system phosphate regulon sensor histidine kinase PhoR